MRILEFYQCSILSFNYGTAEKREPVRPIELRQPDFDKQFDYTSIFMDIFKDYKTNSIYAVGAPLEHSNIPTSCFFEFQQADKTDKSFLNFFSKMKKEKSDWDYGNFFERQKVINSDLKIEKLDRLWRYSWDNVPSNSQILKSTINGNIRYNYINSNLAWSNLCKGRNIVFLKNFNNKFRWIKDYCNYYKTIHKADLFLIYDSSTEYSSLELLDFLRHNTDVSAIVVSWPIPIGPMKFKNSNWDSDYSMYMCFEHAKSLFCQEANAFLYADIDELVVSHDGKSAFDYISSQRESTAIFYSGIMIDFDISNASYDNFSFRHMAKLNRALGKSVIKWTLKINQKTLDKNIQWRVHDLYDWTTKKSLREKLNDQFETRHFIGITTGWRRKNLISQYSSNPECPLLKNNYEKLGWSQTI